MFQAREHVVPNILIRGKDYSKRQSTENQASVEYRVLLVHYSLETLQTLSSMFRKIGYQVTPVENCDKALLYSDYEPYDLLFTDLDMPMLDGYNLAYLIKRVRPRLRAVIMTCRCEAELVDFMNDGTVDQWLFKPFDLTQFKNVLENLDLNPKSFLGQKTRN